MAGGERKSTEEARWGGFMKGIRGTEPVERDEHEFVRHDAPAQHSLPTQTYTPEEEEELLKGLEPADEMLLVPERSRSRLDEIATLVRTLTYGEMIGLAAELWLARPPFLETDSAKKLDGIIEVELPSIWHRWSNERSKGNGG